MLLHLGLALLSFVQWCRNSIVLLNNHSRQDWGQMPVGYFCSAWTINRAFILPLGSQRCQWSQLMSVQEGKQPSTVEGRFEFLAYLEASKSRKVCYLCCPLCKVMNRYYHQKGFINVLVNWSTQCIPVLMYKFCNSKCVYVRCSALYYPLECWTHWLAEYVVIRRINIIWILQDSKIREETGCWKIELPLHGRHVMSLFRIYTSSVLDLSSTPHLSILFLFLLECNVI